MSIAYFNGDYLPLEEVRISPLDRGFLFGDAVYEVIPSYAGEFFLLGPHLERLERSLAAIRLSSPLTRGEWAERLVELLRCNAAGPGRDLGVYLQVTRGTAPRDHAFPLETVPTVFAMASPIRPLPASVRAHGVAAITAPDSRWSRCDIKATTLLANVLARQQAIEADAMEAILLRDGRVTEGAASNILVRIGDTVATPPLQEALLPGVTRALVLDLARECGLRVLEREIDAEELRGADEIWLTSSTREILPVSHLDGEPVGAGVPGPGWRAVHAAYQLAKLEEAQRREEGRS